MLFRSAQAITTGDKMDYTLQKAVELGVARIQPLQTNRGVVRLNQERAEKRLQHWQNIVVSACEQYKRVMAMPRVGSGDDPCYHRDINSSQP